MLPQLAAVVITATHARTSASGFGLASWIGAAQWAGVTSGLFVLVFLVVSTIALCRAQVQDIPETVRALAQLLHPRAASRVRADKAQDRGGEDAGRP